MQIAEAHHAAPWRVLVTPAGLGFEFESYINRSKLSIFHEGNRHDLLENCWELLIRSKSARFWVPRLPRRHDSKRVAQAMADQGLRLSERSEFEQGPAIAEQRSGPQGLRHPARLSFAYFALAKQRKVSRPPGRVPADPAGKRHPARTAQTRADSANPHADSASPAWQSEKPSPSQIE